MSRVNELLELAKNGLVYLQLDKMFLGCNLFKNYEWNRGSRSDRLLIGTLFFNYIKNCNINLEVAEKTSSSSKNMWKICKNKNC